MALRSEIAGSQIDGARDYQEDAFLITQLTDTNGEPSALIIVADGMGGHAAGNVASNMAVQAFNKSITTAYPTDEISEVLNQSILKANSSITETVKETPALDGMGCTMVSALIEGKNLWWVSVGDSHLYLLRDRKLTKLNADHSYGGFLDRMEAAGTPVDAEPGLSKNMLMSAITGGDIAEVDCPPTPFILQHDDKLVICSDGLDTLSEGKIIQYTDWSDTPKECAEALMDAIEDAAMPRQDNTTAVVVKIADSSTADVAAVEDDDSDDEDITTPFAAGTAKIDDPLEMETPEESIDLSPVGAPFEKPAETREEVAETPPEAPPVAATKDVSSEDKEKSKTGLIVGIAATVLIAVAAGGYFMFAGSKPKGVDVEIVSEEVVVEETTSEEQSSPAEVVEESAEEEIVETVTKPAPVEETVAEVQEKPVEKPKPAPNLANKKEFQDDLKDGGKSPMMVVIPAGSFAMGSSPSSRYSDERPRHTVKIESFAVSKYEVTFAEYDLFAKATKRKPPKDSYMDRNTHPVVFVTWDDAYYYTKWLSEQTGKKYRLLSESEWEYAASTGKKSPFWWGYDEEPDRAHCFECKTGLDPRKPSKVGGFDANKFGLHDTAGNVAEWVKDCWHENYKGAPTDSEVWEGGDCNYRAVRGGAYISPQQSIRSAKRDKLKSDAAYDHVGIRLARKLD
jgi:formylglycine-generating enzyme required for sulfatase activity/serine/threonine protein phosphatase PrpC